jgi:hypothetical protein
MKRMKYAFFALTILTLAGSAANYKLAAKAVTAPAYQRPVFCHDEYICTPMGGCRWVTICR